MTKVSKIINRANRMAVLLSSVFCTLNGMAQLSLADKLSHILEIQDMDMGVELYNEIKDSDIHQLPDTALFDYHYLGGYINSEIPNHEKAIYHLLEAKRLCDTSLGVHSRVYMEIMNALGDEYIELREYEEALAYYQEGIVKSLFIRKNASQEFGALIMGVQECYEHLGWFKEIPAHLLDAWYFWTNDDTLLAGYSYYPLWRLEQFYRRYGMYDEALAISDKIEAFIISKGGDNHPELCNSLYFKGNILCDTKRGKDAIFIYERAISIANANSMYDSEILRPLYGNLITTLANEGEFEKCKKWLSKIKNYSIVTNDNRFYSDATYTCARHFGQANSYREALVFVDMIPLEGLSSEEYAMIKDMRDSYLHSMETLSNFDSLVESQSQASVGTSVWYNLSYDIANGFMMKGDLWQCFHMLESIYHAYEKEPTNQDASPLYLMDCLLNLTTQLELDSLFLKYAFVKWDYLNDNRDIPQEYLIININEIIVGQMGCQKLDGIDERFREVESYFRSQYGEMSSEYASYLHNRGRAFQLQNRLEEAKIALLRSISIQNIIEGKPLEKTFKYYTEVIQQLGEL